MRPSDNKPEVGIQLDTKPEVKKMSQGQILESSEMVISSISKRELKRFRKLVKSEVLTKLQYSFCLLMFHQILTTKGYKIASKAIGSMVNRGLVNAAMNKILK